MKWYEILSSLRAVDHVTAFDAPLDSYFINFFIGSTHFDSQLKQNTKIKRDTEYKYNIRHGYGSF